MICVCIRAHFISFHFKTTSVKHLDEDRGIELDRQTTQRVNQREPGDRFEAFVIDRVRMTCTSLGKRPTPASHSREARGREWGPRRQLRATCRYKNSNKRRTYSQPPLARALKRPNRPNLLYSGDAIGVRSLVGQNYEKSTSLSGSQNCTKTNQGQATLRLGDEIFSQNHC